MSWRNFRPLGKSQDVLLVTNYAMLRAQHLVVAFPGQTVLLHSCYRTTSGAMILGEQAEQSPGYCTKLRANARIFTPKKREATGRQTFVCDKCSTLKISTPSWKCVLLHAPRDCEDLDSLSKLGQLAGDIFALPHELGVLGKPDLKVFGSGLVPHPTHKPVANVVHEKLMNQLGDNV